MMHHSLYLQTSEFEETPKHWELIEHHFPCGNNLATAIKAFQKINYFKYKKILVSVSGGSDSDMMLDWCVKMDIEKKCVYVFFDTGLEYEATKRHLNYLEQKYGIKIKRIRAVKPIPLCCKQDGIPFLSKEVSQNMNRLQRHDFKWENGSYDELFLKYPKCSSALRWWAGEYKDGQTRKKITVSSIKLLKEFIQANPPTFKISDKCCHYAKKLPSEREIRSGGYDLKMLGVRQCEGGIRAMAYTSCFTENEDKSYDDFRPLFFITDKDKAQYKKHQGMKNSDCYEVWGFIRTGCAGCPFNSRFETELQKIKKYEPKFYKACVNIFGESYEYTRAYREFKKGVHSGQIRMDLGMF